MSPGDLIVGVVIGAALRGAATAAWRLLGPQPRAPSPTPPAPFDHRFPPPVYTLEEILAAPSGAPP